MTPTKTATTIGSEVISKGSLLSSLVSTNPNRHKSSYKVMGQLRERVSTPTYTTPTQDKKDDDENHQYNWGGGAGTVASTIDIGEDYPPSLILSRWRELICMIISEVGSHV